MFEWLKKLFPSSGKSITTTELEELLTKRKITLLDVRTAQEYRGGHIKETRNFPLSNIATYQGKKSESVYVICHSGMRSKRAASVLTKKGYDVVNVRGGMMAYKGKII